MSTVLGQALKPVKDTRTNEMIALEELYGKGTAAYKAALSALLLKDVRPKEGFKILTETEAKDLLKGAYQEGKAYQQK